MSTDGETQFTIASDAVSEFERLTLELRTRAREIARGLSDDESAAGGYRRITPELIQSAMRTACCEFGGVDGDQGDVRAA